MKFSDIPGQEEIKSKLIKTIIDHRVSHAQLFFGAEGGDKLALAIAYAQLINCKNPSPLPPPQKGRGQKDGAGGEAEDVIDSCGVCPSCIKYQKLIHPDLHFIYPVSTTKKVSKKPRSRDFIEEWRKFLLETGYRGNLHNWYESIGIENKQGIINADDCMEIITTLSYKSYESEYKVMIIWMVEKLFYSAAPKLLKIIEEPPEKTLFILVSEDPDQIISTIRSRTLLIKIPKGESRLSLTENKGSLFLFREWMRLCFAKDVIQLVNWSSEIAKAGRENQKGLLQYALKVLESATLLNYCNNSPGVSDAEEQLFIQRIAPYFQSNNLSVFTELFSTALYHIERNAYAPTLFLDISLQAIRQFHGAGEKKQR